MREHYRATANHAVLTELTIAALPSSGFPTVENLAWDQMGGWDRRDGGALCLWVSLLFTGCLYVSAISAHNCDKYPTTLCYNLKW